MPGLKWRIIAYMSLFCLVIVLILWLCQVVFLENVYQTVKRGDIKRSAASICKNIDNDELETLLSRISQENDICISIYTASGTKIAESHIIQNCIVHHMPGEVLFKYYNDALKNDGQDFLVIPRGGFNNGRYDPSKFEGNVPETDEGMGESLMLTRVVHSDARGEDMVVFLNTMTSPVTATKKALQAELKFIVLILLIGAVIVSIVMAKRISAPITKMSSEARQLAQGNYNVDFSGKGYKESGELASSLNFAAQELSKTDRLQKELMANISHDLRTPLTMISGYAEMMRDIPGEMTGDNLQVIIDESKRLSSLVTDVMDLSKLGADIEGLKICEFNLTKCVEGVIERIERMSDGYTIEFICDHDAIVRADETRILQVVYNLIINAINHTGDDKHVTVRQTVSSEKNSVRIEITDTGEGIAKEDLPYIWDRYYKVDRVHKRANIGSGLGLSIVKSILKLHKACYGVISEKGVGSTFWFELS